MVPSWNTSNANYWPIRHWVVSLTGTAELFFTTRRGRRTCEWSSCCFAWAPTPTSADTLRCTAWRTNAPRRAAATLFAHWFEQERASMNEATPKGAPLSTWLPGEGTRKSPRLSWIAARILTRETEPAFRRFSVPITAAKLALLCCSSPAARMPACRPLTVGVLRGPVKTQIGDTNGAPQAGFVVMWWLSKAGCCLLVSLPAFTRIR
jgi:hypothetical protein